MSWFSIREILLPEILFPKNLLEGAVARMSSAVLKMYLRKGVAGIFASKGRGFRESELLRRFLRRLPFVRWRAVEFSGGGAIVVGVHSYRCLLGLPVDGGARVR